MGSASWQRSGSLNGWQDFGHEDAAVTRNDRTFVVFAVLIFVGVIIVVNLGKLPGQLAHKWNHPQASAINAMSWIGIATGGLLWPVAFIWAFTTPFGTKSAGRRQRLSSQVNPTPLQRV